MIKLFQVDAFTGKPFQGNPAAVCVLEAEASESWMQKVAMEMNLSETAFLWAEDWGYRLRWFTPEVEVDLCGHATLASAHVLWEEQIVAEGDVIRFYTKSGELTARKKDGGIQLDFPAIPPVECAMPAGLVEALGVSAKAVRKKSEGDYLVEVESESVVRALSPDFRKLREVDARGVIVTAKAQTPGFDFVSRFFGPAVGIDEDPVTGSAHCCLGPYWKEKLGKETFRAYQASRRGGELVVTVARDRVYLEGSALTVLRGMLTVES